MSKPNIFVSIANIPSAAQFNLNTQNNNDNALKSVGIKQTLQEIPKINDATLSVAATAEKIPEDYYFNSLDINKVLNINGLLNANSANIFNGPITATTTLFVSGISTFNNNAVFTQSVRTDIINANSEDDTINIVASSINIGTTNSQIIIYGSSTTISETILHVEDKLINVNLGVENTAADNGHSSGLLIRGTSGNGWIQTTTNASNFLIKPPLGTEGYIVTTDLTNNLTISGISLLNNVEIMNDLTVTNNSKIYGYLTVGSNLTVSGSSLIKGALTANSLFISNNSILRGNILISGTTVLKGNVTVGNLIVTGQLSTTNISVLGDFGVPNNITVSGNSLLKGNVTVGNLIVTGQLSTTNISVLGDFGIPGDLNISGNSLLKGNVLIGTETTRNSNVVLELNSTTKGFLPPRMTSTNRESITTPTGLVVYQSDTSLSTKEGLYYLDASGTWQNIASRSDTPRLPIRIVAKNSGSILGITSNTITKVANWSVNTINNTQLNTAPYWDPTNGIFTSPYAMTVRANANIVFNSHTQVNGQYWIGFYVNGSVSDRAYAFGNISSSTPLAINGLNTICNLNPGQQLTLMAYQSSGTTLNYNSFGSTLAIEEINLLV